MEFSFENQFYYHNESPKFWEEGSMGENNGGGGAGGLRVRKSTLCVSSTSGSSDNILESSSKDQSVDLLVNDTSVCEHSDFAGDIIPGKVVSESGQYTRACLRNSQRRNTQNRATDLQSGRDSKDITASQSQGRIGSGNSRSGGGVSDKIKRSWLEEIQFTAQYQHFRSIDYVSVVKSVGSLDRVGVDSGDVVKEEASAQRLTAISSGTTSSSKGEATPVTSLHKDTAQSETNGLCWNFPRVKLRRLFNAKSLDDILGRTSRKTTSSESDGVVVSRSSGGGVSASGIASESSPSINESGKVVAPLPRLSKDSSTRISKLVTVNPVKKKAKGALSGSSSESNCYNKGTRGSAGTTLSNNNPTNCPDYNNQLPSEATAKPELHQTKYIKANKKGDKIRGGGGAISTPTSGGSSQTVKCAKSDNCLHRIVHSTCTKFGANSVDNLESEGGRNNFSREEIEKSESKSPTGLTPIVSSSTTGKIDKRHTKKTQVSPESITSRDSSQLAPARTFETEDMPKDQAKLVVANVTYLQRPLSPSPASIFPSPSSTFSVATPRGGVLNQSNFANETFLSSQRFRNEFPLSPPDPASNTYVQRSETLPSPFSYNNQQQLQQQYNSGNNDALWSRAPHQLQPIIPPFNRNDRSPRPQQDALRLWSKDDPMLEQSPHNSYANYYQQHPNQMSSPTPALGGRISNDGYGGRNTANFAHLSSTPPRFSTLGGGGRFSPFQPLEPLKSSQFPIRVSPRCDYQIQPGPSGYVPEHYYQRCDNSQGIIGGSRLKSRTPDPSAARIITRDPTAGKTKDDMGDLQSPQYVKRTAHMFDSRYNNGEMNGSSPISRSNGNGVTSPTPGQPSYLRVSQSVSGYSCLSYSSNSGASPTPGSNGTSHVIKSPIPLRPFASPDVSISSKAKLTSATRHQSMPEDPRHETNGSSTYQYKKTSSYLESSPEPESRISSYRDGETPHLDNGNGINNYTQNRCKSNILEKIERLYGANAVKSTSLWRRPVPSFQDHPDSGPPARKSYPPHGIPSEARRNETNNIKGSERIIPILVEDAGLKTSNGNRASYEREIVPDRENGKQAFSSFGKVHNISYPQKQVKHDRQDNDLYSKYGNLSLNREDEVNECEQENRGRQGHFQCSSTKVKSDNLYTDTDPSNKSGAILREENRDIKRLVILTAESPKIDTALPHRETLQPSTFSIRTTHEVTDSITSPDIVTQPTAIMTTGALSIQSNQKTEGDDVIDGEAKLIQGIPTAVPAEEDIKIPVQTTTPEQVSPPTITGEASKEVVPKGGEYFLKVVSTERLRIQKLIDEGEIKLAALESDEGSSDSELSGKIWAAIGKAKLLINKKFKQFEGLCNDNIKQTNEGVGDDVPFTTKNEDLEGFWDMVCIQIDQIHEMFRDLDSASPAEVPSPQRKPQPKKPTSPTKSSSKSVGAAARTPDPSKGKNAASAARDELRRKMLAEKRRAMKDQVTKSEEAEAEVQIFTPDA